MAVLRIHPVQQQYVDEFFVDVKGKHTARIGRSSRLMTGTMLLKVTFSGLSYISAVITHRHKGCSVNGTYTSVDFCWNGLIWFFTLKTWCIDAKSIMIQFAVTAFMRLQAAACEVIFYHFVWLTFFVSLFHRKVQMTLIFSLGTFFQPTLFSHSVLFSITCTSATGGIVFNRRQLQLCVSIITRVAH